MKQARLRRHPPPSRGAEAGREHGPSRDSQLIMIRDAICRACASRIRRHSNPPIKSDPAGENRHSPARHIARHPLSPIRPVNVGMPTCIHRRLTRFKGHEPSSANRCLRRRSRGPHRAQQIGTLRGADSHPPAKTVDLRRDQRRAPRPLPSVGRTGHRAQFHEGAGQDKAGHAQRHHAAYQRAPLARTATRAITN